MSPSLLCAKVRECADLGIAHDGDADRVVLCDEAGRPIDGRDDILAIAGCACWPRDTRPKDRRRRPS